MISHSVLRNEVTDLLLTILSVGSVSTAVEAGGASSAETLAACPSVELALSQNSLLDAQFVGRTIFPPEAGIFKGVLSRSFSPQSETRAPVVPMTVGAPPNGPVPCNQGCVAHGHFICRFLNRVDK